MFHHFLPQWSKSSSPMTVAPPKLSKHLPQLDFSFIDSCIPQNNTNKEIENIEKQFVEASKTLKNQLHKSIETLPKSIADLLSEGLVILTEDGTITNFNGACEKIFGYNAEEIIGTSFTTLLSQEEPVLLASLMKIFLSDSTLREAVGRRQDGTAIPIELSLTTVEAGGHKLHYIILRDITSRKKVQLELEKRSRILEAVSYGSRKLLANFNNIEKVLEKLVKAINVDRCYIFLNEFDKSYITKYKYGWPPADNYYSFLDWNQATDWHDRLQNFETISVDVTTDIPFYDFFEKQKASSALLVPIFVHSNWSGVICFESKVERDWTKDEIEGLRGAAGAIAGAIERKNTRKLLENTLQFECLVFDRAPNPIYVKDRQGKYYKVNDAFCQMADLSSKDIIGKTSVDVFGYDFQLQEEELYNKKVETIKYDLEVAGKVWTVYKRLLYNGNDVMGLVGTMIDSTDTIVMAQKLKEEKSVLESILSYIPKPLISTILTSILPRGFYIEKLSSLDIDIMQKLLQEKIVLVEDRKLWLINNEQLLSTPNIDQTFIYSLVCKWL